MTKEFKHIELSGFKMLDEGNGKLEGYPSVFGDIDSYGDIIPKGAYQNTIEDFKQNGFIAHSHDWDVTGSIAMPIEVREDDHGLYCVAEFHSTQDAQDVRTKVRERLAAGKSVGLSIGFGMNSAPGFIYRKDYETELPKYLDETRLPELMEYAKRFEKIRILNDIKLYEYSIVTTPAQKIAQVTGVKAEPEVEVKGDYLGNVEQAATISVASMLVNRLYYYVLYDVLYCDDTTETKLATLEGACEEFKSALVRIVKAILAGESEEDSEEAAKSLREIWPEPDLKSLSLSLGERTMIEHSKAVLATVEEYKQRVEQIAAKPERKDGREISGRNRETLSNISSDMDSLSTRVKDFLESTKPKEKVDQEAVAQLYTQYLANVSKAQTRI